MFGEAVDPVLIDTGIILIRLPQESPNHNAHIERFIRSARWPKPRALHTLNAGVVAMLRRASTIPERVCRSQQERIA